MMQNSSSAVGELFLLNAIKFAFMMISFGSIVLRRTSLLLLLSLLRGRFLNGGLFSVGEANAESPQLWQRFVGSRGPRRSSPQLLRLLAQVQEIFIKRVDFLLNPFGGRVTVEHLHEGGLCRAHEIDDRCVVHAPFFKTFVNAERRGIISSNVKVG